MEILKSNRKIIFAVIFILALAIVSITIKSLNYSSDLYQDYKTYPFDPIRREEGSNPDQSVEGVCVDDLIEKQIEITDSNLVHGLRGYSLLNKDWKDFFDSINSPLDIKNYLFISEIQTSEVNTNSIFSISPYNKWDKLSDKNKFELIDQILLLQQEKFERPNVTVMIWTCDDLKLNKYGSQNMVGFGRIENDIKKINFDW